MEPARIKLYGLFWMTKRRYLFQAVVSVLGAVLILAGWYVAWPGLRARLTQPELKESKPRTTMVAVMDDVPWILFAALAYEAAEVYLVLRMFARKTAAPTQGAKAAAVGRRRRRPFQSQAISLTSFSPFMIRPFGDGAESLPRLSASFYSFGVWNSESGGQMVSASVRLAQTWRLAAKLGSKRSSRPRSPCILTGLPALQWACCRTEDHSMPIHDWTRVDAGIFHAFHHGWIEEFARPESRPLAAVVLRPARTDRRRPRARCSDPARPRKQRFASGR